MLRNKKRMIVAIICASVLMFTAACSGNTNSKTPSDQVKETQSPNSSAAASASPEPVDPLGKYEPAIEVTSVRDLPASIQFREGESIDNNVWSREYEEQLGIKIKYLWTSNADYKQRLNVSIVSGELPDIFSVDSTQLKQLVEAGQVEDLSQLFETYASPFTKKLMNGDPNQMKSATFDNKLMALPHVGSPYDTSQVLWIRADWLKKLGLEEPKTMDDVFKISEAFTNGDPDGNNKKDTFGLALTKDLHLGGFANLQGFFNGYHAYVDTWIKDDSGKLVFGSVQPEVKAALGKLSELYKAGQIDKEFAVKDGSKVMESLGAGKIGMSYGAWWNPAWPLQSVKDQDPAAEWRAYGIPSADATPSSLQLGFPVGEYYVVKKGAANPEAIVKLLNIVIDRGFSENADIEKFFIAKDGFLYNNYPLLTAAPAEGNLVIYQNLKEALESKDISKLTGEEKGYYEKIMSYRSGDPASWTNEGMYGLDSAWPYVKEKVDSGLIQNQEFYGATTKTMGQKNANLNKMMMESFTKIITGEKSVDEFDVFVSNWHKLGGDDITNEVNEWAAGQK